MKFHITLIGICIVFSSGALNSQSYFNAWLTTCSHLIGPSGNPQSLQLAVDQSRGLRSGAPAFDWDILIDVGDWTASQAPPGHEEGEALAQCLNRTLGEDRGRFFTVSGNHDGDAKGWEPGEFTRTYVNPIGDKSFIETSGFGKDQRPKSTDYRQLIDYPGTRWDRYLVRTGNVVWIMLGDRNEFDRLAEKRGDLTGTFQAGRGSAAGMPKGGYPSGSVTKDTFEWWKKVVESPEFSNDILITTHHLMLANTTITTDDGEPGEYHGKSGSVGPKGETGGQLYWIREYDDQGDEIQQYAQTRPFLDYLQDHPGAITAWIGGHSHIHTPESSINGRGIHLRKYGVTFISTGALTDSHAGGKYQMSRLLSFEDGNDEAIVNVYVHKTNNGNPLGWYKRAAKRVPLGKKFKGPDSRTTIVPDHDPKKLDIVPNAPEDPLRPRYYWNLNQDKLYDFNNASHLVGEDGSPYGVYVGNHNIEYSEDTPLKHGKSLDITKTNGKITVGGPYTPEMNWKNLTMSLWCKIRTQDSQELVSYVSKVGNSKFKFWFDGDHWVWEMGNKVDKKTVKWKSRDAAINTEWHHFVAIANSDKKVIQLYVDGRLVDEVDWKEEQLSDVAEGQLIFGTSIVRQEDSEYNDQKEICLLDEVKFYDRVVKPEEVNE